MSSRKPAAKRKRTKGKDASPEGSGSEDGDTTMTIEAALEEISRLRESMEDYKKSYDELHALRHTEPEKRLESAISTADKRKIAADGRYKEALSEIERLRKHTALWSGGMDVMKEIDRRELECERLKEEIKGLKKEVVLRDEMVRTAQEKQQSAEREVSQLDKALAYETEQSKQAAVQLKELQANPASRIPTASKKDQQSNATDSRYDLLSDLTGITIQRVDHTAEGEQYDCLLVDASRKRGLAMAFQLILHPEDQVSYIPKLDADRDKDLMEVLMEPYDDRMRFAYAQLGKFHRKLWQMLLT